MPGGIGGTSFPSDKGRANYIRQLLAFGEEISSQRFIVQSSTMYLNEKVTIFDGFHNE